MSLPDLPKKLNKREAYITPKVIKWFKENYPRSCNVEVKIKGNLPLAHQEKTLSDTSSGLFAYKIPDMGNRNPCDFYMIKGGDGVLVTCDKNNNRWVCECEVYGSNDEPFSITL